MFRTFVASVCIHALGLLALLLSWPSENVTKPELSAHLVYVSPTSIIEADSRKAKPQEGPDKFKTAPRGGTPKARAESPSEGKTSRARNPLLKNDIMDLSPKGGGPEATDFFAKPTEYVPKEPDLRADKHDAYGWNSHIKADGSVDIRDKFPIDPPRIEFAEDAVTIKISFPDITDLIMRLRGDPLYHPEKRKYLAATKDMRLQIASDFKKANLTQALNDLGDRLAAIWFNEKYSSNEKKQRLFDMWDECAEEGSDVVLTMSQIVRVSIKSFISRKMPAGSTLAYSDRELLDLNKNRSSKAEFNPYT